ncbi:MAG: hypothetical protein SPK49_01770 [Erysipelotrichaceae bacterium]|nr:hypothetical protein [Erysipelotrichaceae bacterium]
MYVRAIVNELNEIIAYCSDINRFQIDEILKGHSEYRVICILID